MHLYKAEIQRALKHEKPGQCVPIWELEFQLWGQFTQKPFIVGEEFNKLTSAEKDRAIGLNTEVFVEVSERLHFAALTIPGGYWEVAPGHPAYYWLPQEYRLGQAKALYAALNDRLLLIANTGGVMCMPDANNYVDFSYMLFDAPEKVGQMARDCIASGIRNMDEFADIGFQAVLTASDVADNRGPFFSPDQMARFVTPFIKQYASAAKARNLYSFMHTDGNVTAFMDVISKSGLDALQGLDPVAGMNMRVAQQQYKQTLAMCGNVDCGLLLTGTPESVFNHTQTLLKECGRDGSFILGASNAVQQEVPVENYSAIVEAWIDMNSENHHAREPTDQGTAVDTSANPRG